jgi:hypothetical protein
VEAEVMGNIKFSKIIVVLCIITVHAFAATVFYFNWHGIEVQTELIVSFISAVGVELMSLAWVTAVERKNKKED